MPLLDFEDEVKQHEEDSSATRAAEKPQKRPSRIWRAVGLTLIVTAALYAILGGF